MSRTDLARAILEGWEKALPLHALARPLALLAHIDGESIDRIAALTCGERDARMLRLRELALGTALDCEASCPRCGERLEFEVATEALRQPHGEAGRRYCAPLGRGMVDFRLPTTADLLEVRDIEDADARVRALLHRCVEDGATLEPDDVSALSERMSEADPQGDVRLALQCPACASSWDAPFYIAGFVWAEVERLALRLLDHVHILACSYGWTQDEILGLSATRRQYYLDRCAG